MNVPIELYTAIKSDFEVESEIYRIKRSILSPNQDKMLRWMTSSQILDYVAEHFNASGLSQESVAELRKCYIDSVNSKSGSQEQIATLVGCLGTAGFNVEANPTVVVKLALLWLVIEGIGSEKSKKNAAQNVSYRWRGSAEALSGLYDRLIGNWIDKSTSFGQFQTVFTAKPLPMVIPIKWNTNYLSEVIYFVTLLHEFSLVGTPEDLLRMDHQRLASCFIKVNGEAFRNIKQVKNNHRFSLSDSKRDAIGALVKEISSINWSFEAG